MSDRWAAIHVPLRAEAVDDVSLTLQRLVGSAFAVETRPRGAAGDWPVTAHAYVAPGAGQRAARLELLRALDMLRVAGAGAVGAASEEFVDPDAYRTRWRSFYAPLAVGRRLLIVPAWLDRPADQAERIPIFLDSGMAFGTGRHPTTRLALEALETSVASGDIVVDVGTGSGVLAIAAARLGAARVYAFDRDPDAGPAAAANLQRNGVSQQVTLSIPSTALVAAEPATLVVANIVASTHLKLMGQYAGLLAPCGRLLLGGILDDRVDEVIAAARVHSFSLDSAAAAGEWRLLTFTTETPPTPRREAATAMRGNSP